MSPEKIRNVAIIAHVDHGKTTLVDGLLKQSNTFRANQAEMSQHLIMDSLDQEHERGITITAKQTAVFYNGYKINIIDTPGHADFSGEVERTLGMADGVLLIVDAQEGPMPQTKFVLGKALGLGLKPVVIINKIDKPAARIDAVLGEISDLFLELATDETQLDYPVYYANARDGRAGATPALDPDLHVVFESIIRDIPAPQVGTEQGARLLVAALTADNYLGKSAIGKITQGKLKKGENVQILRSLEQSSDHKNNGFSAEKSENDKKNAENCKNIAKNADFFTKNSKKTAKSAENTPKTVVFAEKNAENVENNAKIIKKTAKNSENDEKNAQNVDFSPKMPKNGENVAKDTVFSVKNGKKTKNLEISTENSKKSPENTHKPDFCGKNGKNNTKNAGFSTSPPEDPDFQTFSAKIDRIFTFRGLGKEEVPEATAGDIVAITGLAQVKIGDTLATGANARPLTPPELEKPTLAVYIGPNTSPLKGQEGEFTTSRQIAERLQKELETNIALEIEPSGLGFKVSGRGELHLSVLIETMRREGFELEVGRPEVVRRVMDGVPSEPVEQLIAEVTGEFVGAVSQELGARRAELQAQELLPTGATRLTYKITTAALIGLRSHLLTATKGTLVMNTLPLGYEPAGATYHPERGGAIIASETGVATAYALDSAQARGTLYVFPGERVYQGMIVGLAPKAGDLEFNVCREKQLTNMRTHASDGAIQLTTPTRLSLEQCLDFLLDDELLEVTPQNLRLRKRELDPIKRKRAGRGV